MSLHASTLLKYSAPRQKMRREFDQKTFYNIFLRLVLVVVQKVSDKCIFKTYFKKKRTMTFILIKSGFVKLKTCIFTTFNR